MDLSLLFKGMMVAGAVAVGVGTTWLLKMKNDNPIEQIAESIIKEETGEDIDLTPE